MRSLVDIHEAEPSVNKWLLMSSPYPLLSILAVYLWFCLLAGPKFMKNRTPYQLKEALVVYNLLQVIVNAYLVVMIISEAVPHINYSCEPIADFRTSHGRFIIWNSYLIFLVKITDLLDTVLFVLRKKYNQISSLHLYHHVIVPLWGWCCLKYFPGGQTWFFTLLNMIVHTAMYTYYFISALGPKYQKYLWWKRYMTTLQIIQFILAFLHGFQGLFRTCNYPTYASVIICVQSAVFFVMFSQFYYKHYISSKGPEELLRKDCVAKEEHTS